MASSTLTLPNFLEARDKPELRRMMFALQVRYSRKIHFFDFQKDGKKWVVWYELPLALEREIDGGE